MTKLTWDAIGTRRYENGVDRGVLYLPDGSAVPWNGLVSVTDTSDATVEEHFLDGVKYLNRRTPEDYSGTLKAVTYPDEFLPFEGIQSVETGLYATAQPVNQTFGLSYRTGMANDEGSAGYKIHLLYNLTAKPDVKTYSTIGSSASADEFSWTLSGIPIKLPNMRPTVHVIIDSNKTGLEDLRYLEDYLYGTETSDGRLADTTLLVNFGQSLITEPITEPI